MNQPYPKRLIEVDLPIKRISAHARREKSIRHGHISTLHIWWARRPLAACRAMICAALWPDPVDALCPQPFREAATQAINAFAQKAMTDKKTGEKASEIAMGRWNALVKRPLEAANREHWNVLRYALLDFIADFASWDNSANPIYLTTSRTLTQAAHEALGGLPETRPLVVDPFAGGWDKIGVLESAADRDRVATKLLERILREERAKEVQAFLEKGVVARWFTPEIVSVILGVSAEEGRAIYDKLNRHSFVERHPYGLKFHDKIRELLLERLKFNKPEYERIVKRLTDYYAEKAGINQEGGPETAASSPKYNIHIHDSANIIIGDEADVKQTPDEP